jgi:hypothetical protein
MAMGNFARARLMTAIESIRFQLLAAHYREQADICRRMAEEAFSPYDEEWLRLAARWTELQRKAETKWRGN